MDLRDVEQSPGLDEACHDPRPAADVGQPAKDPARRVDDVELVPEPHGQLIDVRLDETRIGDAKVGGELAGEPDRRRGEVDSRDACAQPSPRQRVEAEVALEVEQALALDVADRGDLIRPDAHAPFAEAGHVVELALRVHLRPRVPEALVRGEGSLEVLRLAHLTAPTRRRRRAPGRQPGRTPRPGRPARGSTVSRRVAGRRTPPRADRSSAPPARRGQRRGRQPPRKPSPDRPARRSARRSSAGPSSMRASMRSGGTSRSVAERAASAKRSSHVGSIPPLSER